MLKEIQENMEKLNDWALEGNIIVKDCTFKDFKEALEFINKVGEIAEKHTHQPDIMISYNRVKLSLTTHSEGGLTQKDFDVALEIDSLSK